MSLLGTAFRVHPSSVSEKAWEKGGFLLGGGSPSYTGKNVTEESALEFTAVWSAVTQISQDKASLPLDLFKRLSPRGKKRWTSNPLYHLMHTQPNPEMTSMVYRERGMRDVLLWGNDYSEIVEDEAGVTTELWPLFPDKMIVKRIGGELFWFYSDPNGKTAIFTARQILHIPGFGNGIMGYNPINKGRQAIAIGQAIEEFSGLWFGQGAKPGAILEHPENLSEDAQKRLKKSWYVAHGGLSKSNRVAILEEGMKLKEYGVDPEKSQMLESKEFSVVEIARIFNIPLHRLKSLIRATFSNIEHQDLEYAKYTLRPWLVRYEQAYNTKLLTPKQQKNLFFEHNLDGLLRGDIASRYESYSKGIQNGVLSPNDAREKENLNPYIGGDEYFIQLNMQNVKDVGLEEDTDEVLSTEPPEGEDEGRGFDDSGDLENCECGCLDGSEHIEKREYEKRAKSVRGIGRIRKAFLKPLKKTAQEVINKETVAVKRAVKKFIADVEERGVNDFKKWTDGFYDTHAGFVEQKFAPILRTYQEMIAKEAGSVLGSEVSIDDLEAFLNETIESFVERYISSSRGQIDSIIKDITAEDLEALAIALNLRMDEWFERRSSKVANDESVRFANSTSRETWLVLGTTSLIWVTVGKNCPFCNSLSGKRVGISKPFMQAGGSIKAGGRELKSYGNRFHPPIHQGCNCLIVPG